MARIWANRLIAGTKTWNEVPASRKPSVRTELKKRVAENIITSDKYKEITSEDYQA